MEQEIIKLLKQKSSTKQLVYRKTKKVFNNIQILLNEKAIKLNSIIQKHDKDVEINYSSNGEFEAQLMFSGETLFFHMHTNVFDFVSSHSVHKSNYVKEDSLRSFCGIINIYNFLSDSFKYNRFNDEVYLIARIFVNKDNHIYVEGENQLGFLYTDFENQIFSLDLLSKIINSAMIFSLNDDLITPDFKSIQVLQMHQIIQMSNNNKIKTSKRLGYRFSNQKK